MKAIEWANKFNAAPGGDELAVVIEEFLQETNNLLKQRLGKDFRLSRSTPSVMVAVLREQRQKWMAITKHCKIVNMEIFDTIIEIGFPEFLKLEKSLEQIKKPVLV